MFEYQSSHYEPKTDDLFLVYTAINGEFNANGWRVEDIDKNIKTGLGRPGVIKPKDQSNPDDTNQEGQFVHPVFRNASLQALLQNQESFSIARAVRLDKPSASANWRVWLQVTDPDAKIALKNASASYPKYISPQVITFPSDFPDEEQAKTYKHWLISHWAFVDIPAYGEQMKVRGNCYGDIDGCKIKLQNASTAGFCVKQALNNLSSHNANSQTQNIMSESTNATTSQTSSQPVQANNQTGQITYTWPNPTISPTGTTANLTIPINNPTQQQQAPGHSKQETEPDSNQKPGMAKGDASGSEAREPNKEEEKGAESLAELKKAYSDLQKRFALLEEDNVVRKQNEKKLYASSKVARYSNHFKSKESFEKEVDTIVRYSQVMSEDELESYLADKYARIEAPIIKAKSASAIVQSTMHEVPEVKANNASSISSDNNRKFIELVDMFSNGGTS